MPAETLAAIEAGAAAGLQELEAEVTEVPGSSGLFGSRAFMKNDYKKRALGAMIGIYGNSIEEAYYSSFAVDAAGALLDGENAYKLRFPSGGLPPVDLFWSMTMYGLPDRQLVANEIKRYSIGDRTSGLVTAEDGSLTLYIQHDRPEGDKGPTGCRRRRDRSSWSGASTARNPALSTAHMRSRRWRGFSKGSRPVGNRSQVSARIDRFGR